MHIIVLDLDYLNYSAINNCICINFSKPFN